MELLEELFDWSGFSPTTEPRPLLISISLSIGIFSLFIVYEIFGKVWIKLIVFKIYLKKYFSLFLFSISLVLITNFVSLIFFYLLNGNFANHTEPTITAVSWLFQTGHPIYHELDSAERYSLIYGPMLYLINGLFLKLFEPSILTAKIASVLAVLIALILMFFILRKNCNLPTATFYCGYMTLALLCFGSIVYTVRSDSLILMFVSLGLLGVFKTNPWVAASLCALALGVSINLKISAFLYFIPIYLLLQRRQGWYYTIASLLCSGFAGLAPFCFHNISLKNYIIWISQVSNHGLLINQLKQNVEWSLYLFWPLSIAWYFKCKDKFSKNSEYNIYLLVLTISTFFIVLIAAKPGSGVHHLIPLIPLYIHFFSLTMNGKMHTFKPNDKNPFIQKAFISIFIAFYLAAFQTGLVKEILTIDYLNTIPAADILKDISNIEKSNSSHTREMGYGTNEDYYFTFYRPVLVFDGNPYLVDADALMDMQKSNLNIPNKTLDYLRSCRTEIWLIPKDKPPFQQPNYYPPNNLIFSNAFKKTFLDKYKKLETSKYYDLWFCKDKL